MYHYNRLSSPNDPDLFSRTVSLAVKFVLQHPSSPMEISPKRPLPADVVIGSASIPLPRSTFYDGQSATGVIPAAFSSDGVIQEAWINAGSEADLDTTGVIATINLTSHAKILSMRSYSAHLDGRVSLRQSIKGNSFTEPKQIDDGALAVLHNDLSRIKT